MERPYIICHMTTSIDGKVTGDFLAAPESAAAIEHYYQINRDFKTDGFACGRVTMEGSFTGGSAPDLSPFEDAKPWRGDYVADPTATYFAVSFDRRGRLGWKAGRISDEDPGYDNSHIIEVMCNDASDSYLAYLRSIGVSYIFAGEREMDISLALKKLRQFFGIKTLLLEGGSNDVLGGILLGVIEILGKAYVSTELSDALVFGVLIIVLLVKPTGLLGKKVHEKV